MALTKINTAGITDDAVTEPKISASGTASSTTFLRGDMAWSAITETLSIDNLTDALVENNSIWLGNDPSSVTDTAASNVAVGIAALGVVTTGDDCIAIGHNALSTTTTGSHNTAVGSGAALALTTATQNTGVGSNSLRFTTTGAYNTVISY